MLSRDKQNNAHMAALKSQYISNQRRIADLRRRQPDGYLMMQNVIRLEQAQIYEQVRRIYPDEAQAIMRVWKEEVTGR